MPDDALGNDVSGPGTSPGPDSTPSPGPSGKKPARSLRTQLVVAALLAAFGFAFVVQIRDYQKDDQFSSLRETELVQILDGLTGTAERARAEIERLETTRDDLLSERRAREAALEDSRQRAETLNIIAGLVPVEGPGLRVTITETSGRVTVTSLLDMVQELRTAGAEAMEFNDSYRLAAQSSFENGVGGIELEGQLLEPPYVLEVIGDPHTLEGALRFQSGPVENLETYDGATVRIEELEQVEIRSVREPVRPTFSQPVE
jgi:uncharacterized protein YlxW (UPF0749 family)